MPLFSHRQLPRAFLVRLCFAVIVASRGIAAPPPTAPAGNSGDQPSTRPADIALLAAQQRGDYLKKLRNKYRLSYQELDARLTHLRGKIIEPYGQSLETRTSLIDQRLKQTVEDQRAAAKELRAVTGQLAAVKQLLAAGKDPAELTAALRADERIVALEKQLDDVEVRLALAAADGRPALDLSRERDILARRFDERALPARTRARDAILEDLARRKAAAEHEVKALDEHMASRLQDLGDVNIQLAEYKRADEAQVQNAAMLRALDDEITSLDVFVETPYSEPLWKSVPRPPDAVRLGALDNHADGAADPRFTSSPPQPPATRPAEALVLLAQTRGQLLKGLQAKYRVQYHESEARLMHLRSQVTGMGFSPYTHTSVLDQRAASIISAQIVAENKARISTQNLDAMKTALAEGIDPPAVIAAAHADARVTRLQRQLDDAELKLIESRLGHAPIESPTITRDALNEHFKDVYAEALSRARLGVLETLTRANAMDNAEHAAFSAQLDQVVQDLGDANNQLHSLYSAEQQQAHCADLLRAIDQQLMMLDAIIAAPYFEGAWKMLPDPGALIPSKTLDSSSSLLRPQRKEVP